MEVLRRVALHILMMRCAHKPSNSRHAFPSSTRSRHQLSRRKDGHTWFRACLFHRNRLAWWRCDELYDVGRAGGARESEGGILDGMDGFGMWIGFGADRVGWSLRGSCSFGDAMPAVIVCLMIAKCFGTPGGSCFGPRLDDEYADAELCRCSLLQTQRATTAQ